MVVYSSLSIEYWELNQDSSPILEFISGIEPERARAKIMQTIGLLRDTGMSLLTNPRVFKKIIGYNKLYELRISWGKAAYRILVVIRDSVAYLVHAFKKQKRIEQEHLRLGAQRRDVIFGYNLAN